MGVSGSNRYSNDACVQRVEGYLVFQLFCKETELGEDFIAYRFRVIQDRVYTLLDNAICHVFYK